METSLLAFLLISLAKVIVVVVILLMAVAYTVLLERKLVGRIQNRWGPSRVGPFGLLQPLMDGAKLFLKEDLMPEAVYRPLYILAPIIALGCALMSIAVVPFGADIRWKGVDLFQIADVNIGLLIILGITSVGVYGIALSGWSSNNKYSLLGALRCQRPGHQLRAGPRPLARRRRAALRLAPPPRHRRRSGHPRPALVEFLRRIPVCRLPHLHHGRVCRNQPRPLRSSRGGERAYRRLPHRIQLHEIRHVLHGRVRQHDHRRLRRHPALLRRMDQPLRQPVPRDPTTRSSSRSSPSSGLSPKFSASSFSTSGCAGRFRASVTTSSWASDGNF